MARAMLIAQRTSRVEEISSGQLKAALETG
jgi:hypothetical protein